MKKHNVISDTNSEVTHVFVEGKLRHAVIKTLVIANEPEQPAINGFELVATTNRKIIRGEFAGYYEGRVYTNTYYMFLD